MVYYKSLCISLYYAFSTVTSCVFLKHFYLFKSVLRDISDLTSPAISQLKLFSNKLAGYELKPCHCITLRIKSVPSTFCYITN